MSDLDQEIPIQSEDETSELAWQDYERHLDMADRLRNIDAELTEQWERERQTTAEQIAWCDEVIAQLDSLGAAR
jgi:hypothetical protein